AIRDIQVEGFTVEDAIRKALKILGASKEDVIITVLKEEQKGLFGMAGAETAKIKATRKPPLK
ncbi:MAG: Jag N-terminal domain-containing protein, partial [Candidatus Omnitrophica bacterium]|nr:Jag N-terminal domain-containing protein [Candidatus Omnitrophota bacterium]